MEDSIWTAKYRGMTVEVTEKYHQEGTIALSEFTVHKKSLTFFISEQIYDQHGPMFMVGFDFRDVELHHTRMKNDNPLYKIREEIISILKNTPSNVTVKFSENITGFLNKLNMEFEKKLKMLDKISSIDFLEYNFS